MSKFQGNRYLAVMLGMMPISGLLWLDSIQPLPSFAESRLSIPTYEVENPGVLAQNSQSPDRKAEIDNRLKSCRELLGKSQYQLAVKACLEAADYFKSVKNREGEAKALTNTGNAYSSQRQYAKAIEFYQQSLKISRDIGERNLESVALGNIALVYEFQKQYAKAIEFYQQSLKIARNIGEPNLETNALIRLSNTYFLYEQHAKAIEFYQQSLENIRKIGDHNLESVALVDLGNVYYIQKQYDKAIEFYQQGLKIARKINDRKHEGYTLYRLGDTYRVQKQYDKAIEFHQQSLKIAREINDRNLEIYVLGDLGRASGGLGISYYIQRQYGKAIEFHQQSLKIAREINDRNLEAYTLGSLGHSYYIQKQYDKAIEFYQQSLKIGREINDHSLEAIVLISLKNVYDIQGEYAKAIEISQQSPKIAREIDDRSIKAIVLSNLRNVYNIQGEYAKAIEISQQSLKIAREISDRNGEASALVDLGDSYYLQGEYAKAIEISQQSLKIAREIDDRNAQVYALFILGKVYSIQGESSKAIEFYQQSLKIAREIDNRNAQVNALAGLGDVYVFQSSKAIEFYQQSLKIAREIGDLNSEANVLFGLGKVYDVYDIEGKLAIEFYQQSLKIAHKIGNRNGEANVLKNLGWSLVKQNNPNLAIFFYKQSVKFTESIRKDIQNLPESKLAYTQTITEKYRQLATLLFQQNRPVEALQVLDLLKVQELQDFLKDVKGNDLTAQGVELLPAEKTLLNTLNITPNFNLQSWIDSNNTKTQIARIQAEAKDQTQLKTYKDLQDRLQTLSKDSALFYPLILPDRIELVVLLPNQPPIHKTVSVKQEDLEKNIKEYRRYAPSASSFKLTQEVSAQLYDWLIKPIAAELKQANIKTIVYAPDGSLRYVPLAGLYDGKRWLIEDYQVNYVTAFSLTSLNKPKISNPKVLAGAYTDTTLPLPNALTEIKAIGKEFPQAVLLSEKTFNRAAFTPERLNQFNFVHLATHGKLDATSAELSFISFNNKESIRLKEIQNWDLSKVNLVTLSACQSSLGGKESNGIEVLGFGYQFQLAKVDATISTLWTINDNATSQLMQRFYSYLKQGQSPNAALRHAQIDLIQGKVSSDSQNLSHPFYWAPFILVGNGF